MFLNILIQIHGGAAADGPGRAWAPPAACRGMPACGAQWGLRAGGRLGQPAAGRPGQGCRDSDEARSLCHPDRGRRPGVTVTGTGRAGLGR